MEDDEDDKVIFNYKYIGGNNYTIPIIVYYQKGVETVETLKQPFSIDLPNVDPTEPEKPNPIDGNKIVPTLAIISSKTITSEAGRATYLPITIKNSSDSTAFDISATAELDGYAPITIEGSGYESISRLTGGRTTDIEFKVRIDDYAENKTYPIKINFQFYNDYGISFTGSDTIYVKVENRNTKPLISIKRVDIMPQISEAGKPTIVGFELQNNGTLEAKDVKVSLGGISNDTFTISSGFNSKYVENTWRKVSLCIL